MFGEYLIHIDDTNQENVYISVPYGYNEIPSIEETINVIDRLKAYVKRHNDNEIRRENKRRKDEVNERSKLRYSHSEIHNNNNSGYVYLLECEGKHKIGYSKNVERRIKQLDTRPFELKLISKIYSNAAYLIEQSLHGNLFKYKVAGEWYNFDFEITPEIFEKWVREQESLLKE